MLKNKIALLCCIWCGSQMFFGVESLLAATSLDYKAVPPFISSGAPPLVMLVMGRDHKLYYEAYNDASDLNDDGKLDIRYTPAIDYYGYFDSHKCYEYSTAAAEGARFNPKFKTTDKTCDGNTWSGDYLNYLTMSRMDTIRKVLYGGFRSTDSMSETVLQRVYVPQDAHTWGKEYTSIAVDKYDIHKYTPFTEPVSGLNLRHLFASTTLSANGTPILRYALNNTTRIWKWVADEGKAAKNTIGTGATGHPGHPKTHAEFETMVNKYATNGLQMGSGSVGTINGSGNPYDASVQDNYLAIFTGKLKIEKSGTYYFGVDGDDAVEVIIDKGTPNEKIAGYYGGHGALNRVAQSSDNTTDHPSTGPLSVNLSVDDNPHTLEFRMEEAGGGDNYYLYWQGPDDSSFKIVPQTSFTDLTLSTYRLSVPASTVIDLVVRVKVCDPDHGGLEANCKQYPDGNYKPIGLLQRHGEPERMYFGLLTGSYAKSTSGGVLRKNVSDINDEIIAETGQFQPETNAGGNGIIQTLNKLRIYGYDYGAGNYPADATKANCGWITNGAMTEGHCRDWGNPLAEMMYETQRYFAGKSSPRSEYNYETTNDDDNKLFLPSGTTGLPQPAWRDPYNKNVSGFDDCSKPFMLMLSDINPSYDSDQLPGVDLSFGTGITDDLPAVLPTLNVKQLAKTISDNELGSTGQKYIGQSGNDSDSICSEKTVTSFGNIRGLCPEEPTKRGGYYSAAVAYYGHITDMRNDKAEGKDTEYDQSVTTYSVGLASPLPRIELSLGADKKKITLVPYGKTVSEIGQTKLWNFKPTNTIVDFFVETITPTYGKFRINYEDVEQGADHDMDAIVIYEYQLINDALENVDDSEDATKVKISLASEYASGSYIQHLGYIISGTTADGPYLEVRDHDTSDIQDIFYADGDTLPVDYTYTPTKLPQSTYRIFTPATGTTTPAQLLTNPLWYAAKWGAFDDRSAVGTPGFGIPDTKDEWDKDNDGVPDTYFYVTNPLRLEEQLNRSFASILNQASSGTAASVISNTRSGEGAVYQSIFYPTIADSLSGNSVSWVGQVHSLLVDGYGNMREDSNGNRRLDLKTDAIIEYDGSQAHRYYDIDGDGILEDIEKFNDSNGDGILQDDETSLNEGPVVDTTNPLKYLWNSTDWLNAISDDDIILQRSSYVSETNQRYIFTWVDGDGDGIVDSEDTNGDGIVDSDDTNNEVKDFIWPNTVPPGLTGLADKKNLYAYLNLYSSFGDRPEAITNLITAAVESPVDNPRFVEFLIKETGREINYIRGLDDVEAGSPKPLSLDDKSDIAGTELRSRQFNGHTWRLGDIAYSTPTAVDKPSEGYHLLYRDDTYADFAAQYEKRRTVIYSGANDGMLHAFNGGFYDHFNKQFCREITEDYDPYDASTDNNIGCVDDDTTTMPELGAELWAYIPFNLLPHLHWLTEPGYEHSYYVDQKPRIFDAKIFPPDSVGDLHPHGWGTVMVVGMRFGGASIKADLDKTVDTDDANNPVMKSAFMIFDITDPEIPPKLLGEITMPQMGFSTSYPTMVVMKDGDHDKVFENYNDSNPKTGENRWFLAFGSGPANSNGDPDHLLLDSAASNQTAKFYMLDMVKLASKNEIWTLTDDASSQPGVLTQGLYAYSDLDANSFVSDPVSVDFNLDYNADVVYYGTVSGDSAPWSGKMRRIVIQDIGNKYEDLDSSSWGPDSILFDAQQPITAAATVALDDDGKNWVFFGTGRYFVDADESDMNLQSYYGIKEPVDPNNPKQKKWTTVTKSNLVDTTKYRVFTDSSRTVDHNGTATNWADIVAEQARLDGWFIDFKTDTNGALGERNLGQAVLLGGALAFTTFIPSDDVCVAEGESFLWAQYYKTGTAYFNGILGTGSTSILFNNTNIFLSTRKISLGQGLATSPNLHVGSEDGSKAFVQTSTGAIKVIDLQNPHDPKSGMRSWKESD